MLLMGVNLWAVLAAAVASMIIGFVWYSPILFAKPWMLAMGYDPEDKVRIAEMQKTARPKYGISFLASLLTAFVLGKFMLHFGISTYFYGAKVGFEVWIAFVLTVQLTDKLFSNRPLKLFLINTGYQFVCYLVIGAVVSKWAGY
jgi:Protein of unknown function (DUF1761)